MPASAPTAGAQMVAWPGASAVRARFRNEVRDHEERDQKEDQPGVPGEIEAFRAGERAAVDGQRHAEEGQDLEDVLDERVRVARGPAQEHEVRNQPLDDEGNRAHRQHEKAAEDQDVEEAGVEVAEHALLREGVFEGSKDALADPREPVVRPAGEEHADPPRHRVDEDRDREEDEQPEHRSPG